MTEEQLNKPELPTNNVPTNSPGLPTNDILELVGELVGNALADDLPTNMVGGPWVEVYSPNGRNYYRRRRCRVRIGGQIRKVNLRYLGSVKNEQETVVVNRAK